MELSGADARRLTLTAQGFGRRPKPTTPRHVRDVVTRVLAVRMDSINVVTRAHYIAPFSRLGDYRANSLDDLTYGKRQLFEGWANGNAILPIELYPLLHYRRKLFRATGARGPSGERLDPRYVDAVLTEIEQRGPLAAAELSVAAPPRGKWWGWSNNKIAVEHLWGAGQLEIAGREGFVRLYDIAERVIPAEQLRARPPADEDAQKEVLCLSARAFGVASGRVLASYFGLNFLRAPTGDGTRKKPAWPRLVEELVEDGRLVKATIEGWREPAYVSPQTRPVRTLDVRALVSPFDPLMRGPAGEVFGFEQYLGQQLYVPENRRVFGYYVLPFLLGDDFVARCDLKAERDGRALLVHGAYLEGVHSPEEVAGELAEELWELARWLGLERVIVGDRGDLAATLKKAVASRSERRRQS